VAHAHRDGVIGTMSPVLFLLLPTAFALIKPPDATTTPKWGTLDSS
jgi:hypothetical protein